MLSIQGRDILEIESPICVHYMEFSDVVIIGICSRLLTEGLVYNALVIIGII